MSKIHEALKKAQLERESNLTTKAKTIAGENGSADGMALNAVPPVMPSGRSMAERDRTAGDFFRLDYLGEHCVKPVWNIDPNMIVFSGSANGGAAAEQFRTLRSRLYRLREVQSIRSLLVTSALAGEGKTFIASNLAHAISRQEGQRVLLIDCDLRSSKLHLTLQAPLTPGLSEYLRSKASLTDVLQHGMQENLYFIPGGSLASDPTELISNGRLKDLIERLTPTFDWIILDSPPTLPVSDASSLADICDGVLLAIQAAVTSGDAVQRAASVYRERNLVGVVLNRVNQAATYGSYYAYAAPVESRK